jgi:hypothetical protein
MKTASSYKHVQQFSFNFTAWWGYHKTMAMILIVVYFTYCRSQSPELSSLSRHLGSGARIPLKQGCLCKRLFCVCVVLCIDSGLATGLSLVQGILRLCKKRLQKPKKR